LQRLIQAVEYVRAIDKSITYIQYWCQDAEHTVFQGVSGNGLAAFGIDIATLSVNQIEIIRGLIEGERIILSMPTPLTHPVRPTKIG